MSADAPVPGAEPTEPEGPFLTSPSATSGPEPAGRVTTPETGVQAVREHLREELAMFIAVAAYPDDMWSVPTAGDAERIAEVVLSAGFRRVSEDDTTVERVMWACAAVDDYLPGELSEAGVAYYAAMARAAVRALREETT